MASVDTKFYGYKLLLYDWGIILRSILTNLPLPPNHLYVTTSYHHHHHHHDYSRISFWEGNWPVLYFLGMGGGGGGGGVEWLVQGLWN